MTGLRDAPAGPDTVGPDISALSPAKRALLERRLGRLSATPVGTIRRREPDEAPVMSYAQERVWFMEQLAPGTAAYGVPLQLRFGADVDVPALGRALREMCVRHEALRTRFPSTADGTPYAVIDAEPTLVLAESEVPDEESAVRRIDARALRGFDLAAGPLIRAELIRIAGPLVEHALVLDMHHIVTDGWSNDILLKDLVALYRAYRTGAADGTAVVDRPAPPVQYADFAAWQRRELTGPAAEGHLRYWVDQLRGVPTLNLATDFPRPATQSFGGASERFRLDATELAALNALSRRHRSTLFMTLLGAYEILLARYSGQQEFAVGTPIAGRSAAELDQVVGMFVNMLPLRADLSGEPTVAELLARTRAVVLDGLAHEAVPFERVVQDLKLVRDPSRPPLFQAMFVLQNYFRRDPQAAAAAEPEDIGWAPVDLPATRFELELHAYENADGGLSCRFVYNTALFTAESVRSLAASFTALVRRLPAADDVALGDLDLVDDAERARLASFNDTAVDYPADETLTDLIDAQCAATPDAVVSCDGGRSVTFAGLAAEANRVAHRLRAEGVGPGAVVAVCAERSVELVVALLGVLKAGGCYLPLDPDYPVDRLAFMAEDSGAVLTLTTAACAALVTTPSLRLDDPAVWADQPTTTPVATAGPADAAYLIYTSGSTGRPKGVPNSHAGIVNRLRWMQDRFGLDGSDAVLQKTPASFDVSVWEFFWPLMTGARLVLAEPAGHRDPAYLRTVIDSHGITTAHFVPSMLAVFLSGAPADDVRTPSLRRVVCSGEELRADTALDCLDRLPGAELHNLYGPTEAAVDVTAWRCDAATIRAGGRVPIGGAVANTTIRILDEALREVPIGALGQLHIGGVQVALGYHRRPELTAERFVPDPWGAPGARMYATGDLARWRPDGTVEFHGRIDGQVKLRGLRIELGEIEHALQELPGITAAAAAVKGDGPDGARLVGYVVADPMPAADELRTALATRLPAYMVPGQFVVIDALPLSPNGKLDRRALPEPETGTTTTEYVEPADDIERAIADIWAQVLGAERVGTQDNFFDLGGHSLLATQVIAKLRPLAEQHGGRIGVMDMFQHPTVGGLARLLSSDQPTERGLLYELTKPMPAGKLVRSYVCVPYGGGSAVVYQPLADALPAGHRLFSVAIPGHDIGLDEEGLPFDELATRCVQEVLDKVDGRLVLYGHCGVGGALIVEMGRRLEAAGREVEAIYTGGIFPFARARGPLARMNHWIENRTSNRTHANWMKSMGVDMDEIDPAQADRIITNMRRDSDSAEEHFTTLLDAEPERLRAPIISVVGERDPITDYYQERYREWGFLTDRTAVFVLAEAGHFFLRYRAQDLVAILTRADLTLFGGPGDALPVEADGGDWWLEGADDRSRPPADPTGPVTAAAEPEPSMRRFLGVASGQLVSVIGSQLLGWAIPIWVLQRTGSLTQFGLIGVLLFLPVIITLPFAGALADRFDRRHLMLISGAAAAATEVALAVVLWVDPDTVAPIYVIVVLLALTSTVQRIAFTAAIPQLVPKRFIGHANGVVQLINGAGQLFVPLAAAGLLALIGLRGILIIDIASYAFALTVLSLIRFPNLMGRVRKETFGQQLLGGLSLTWRNRYFRAMLIFFSIGNLLYAPALLLPAPLVLGFDSLSGVGQAAAAEAAGAIVGGLAMSLWGGPGRLRMRVIIGLIAASGIFVALTGLRPSLALVMVGLAGTTFALALANGIYMTIIQTKIPQRYHGRVIALNQTIAWSTFPIGFALAPLLVNGVLEPAIRPGGELSDSVGAVIGTGEGRGVGLAFVVFGLLMLVNAVAALGFRRLRNLDAEIPDAAADDLVGVEELRRLRSQGEPVAVAR